MKNVKEFLKNVFQNSTNDVSGQQYCIKEFPSDNRLKVFPFLDAVVSFLEYFLNLVNKLEFSDEPNYSQIQTKLSQTIKECGYANDENFGLLTSTSSKTTGGKRKQKEATPVSTPNGGKAKGKATASAAAAHVSETDESDHEEELKDSICKPFLKNSSIHLIKF